MLTPKPEVCMFIFIFRVFFEHICLYFELRLKIAIHFRLARRYRSLSKYLPTNDLLLIIIRKSEVDQNSKGVWNSLQSMVYHSSFEILMIFLNGFFCFVSLVLTRGIDVSGFFFVFDWWTKYKSVDKYRLRFEVHV